MPEIVQHPVDAFRHFLQEAGGCMTATDARMAMDAQGLGPHYRDALDFWKSTGFLAEDGAGLRLVHPERVTPDSPISPAHWLRAVPPVAPPAPPAEAAPPSRCCLSSTAPAWPESP